MTKKTKQFLDEERDKKIKGLMSLTLDHFYFDDFLESNDEDKARDELKEVNDEMEKENLKLSRTANGKILSDNRDMKKVNELANRKAELNALITNITNTKQERLKNEDAFEQVLNYYLLVKNFDDEVIKELDKISEL